MKATNNAGNYSAETAKLAVLIVDDEPDIRSALSRILNLEGYLTAEACSGREALGLLARQPCDVLVLDLRLPDLDGLSVMEQARQRYPDLLFVILTGYGTLQSAIAAAKTEGVVDYLLKPARNEEIVKAIGRAVQRRAQRIRQQHLLEAAGHILEAATQLEQLSALSAASATLAPPTSSDNNSTIERFVSVPPLVLDRKKRLVTIQGDASTFGVELTKGETAVLTSLMKHPGQILSCVELVSKAWGYEVDEFEAKSIIRPHILRLRQKVETNPKEPCLIGTVRRRGYRLNPGNEFSNQRNSAQIQL